LSISRWDPNPDSYPCTGRGFTGSKEIFLPEYYQEARKFVEGDMMYIRESKAGNEYSNLFLLVIQNRGLNLIKLVLMWGNMLNIIIKIIQ